MPTLSLAHKIHDSYTPVLLMSIHRKSHLYEYFVKVAILIPTTSISRCVVRHIVIFELSPIPSVYEVYLRRFQNMEPYIMFPYLSWCRNNI